MDLLLDVNVVADLALEREPHASNARAALTKAEELGHRAWIYTGSVQTILFVISNEYRRVQLSQGRSITTSAALSIAKAQLHQISRSTHWLAALAEDGDVLEADDPEDAQLLKAVERLGAHARLLTRDQDLLTSSPRAVSSDDYLKQSNSPSPIEFIDLRTQQDRIRNGLETRLGATPIFADIDPRTLSDAQFGANSACWKPLSRLIS